ncbi:MAG: flagellar export protein FliJ [Candidatus Rokubacteria bacterium]|nr:flagellar export protein FliJ [Candidatus Rokubacteria bacterium]
MSTPYSALLRVRRVVERDAEIAIAQARHTVAALEDGLATLGVLRQRWVESAFAAAPGSTGVHGQITAIEATETALAASLARAEVALDEARAVWTERHRDRRVAEELETRTLEERRLEAERREQAVTDDLAAILRLRATGVWGEA